MRKNHASLAQSIGARSEQQDRITAYHHKDGIIAILADGMGGLPDGALAAESALSAVRKHLRPRRLNTAAKVYAAFEGAVSAASESVRSIPRTDGRAPGTTLVVAIVRDDFYAVMGVGDSYAILRDPDEQRHLLPPHEAVSGGLTSCVPGVDDVSFHAGQSAGRPGCLVIASDGFTTGLTLVVDAESTVQRQINGHYRNQDNVSVICIPFWTVDDVTIESIVCVEPSGRVRKDGRPVGAE